MESELRLVLEREGLLFEAEVEGWQIEQSSGVVFEEVSVPVSMLTVPEAEELIRAVTRERGIWAAGVHAARYAYLRGEIDADELDRRLGICMGLPEESGAAAP